MVLNYNLLSFNKFYVCLFICFSGKCILIGNHISVFIIVTIGNTYVCYSGSNFDLNNSVPIMYNQIKNVNSDFILTIV